MIVHNKYWAEVQPQFFCPFNGKGKRRMQQADIMALSLLPQVSLDIYIFEWI